MNVKKDMPKLSLKLSLKKETLRVLSSSDLHLLDAVVGGTEGSDTVPPDGGCRSTEH